MSSLYECTCCPPAVELDPSLLCPGCALAQSQGTRYDRPASAAPPAVCTDCGGKGWRRSTGAVACACLVEEVRSLRAEVTRLAARLAAVGLVLLLALTPARAAECEHYLPAVTGEPSPCDGITGPTSDLMRLLSVEDERDLCLVDLEAERRLRALDQEEARARVEVCESSRLACERDKAPPPVARAWWDSPWVGAVVGVVVGVGVAAAVAHAVR